MKKIRTARELYCEILKSFYLGTYRKNDKYMTYQQIHETYGLAKKTIGAAYNMLQQDGFIYTNGSNGTIVTFDLNNPEHVAKVPIECPKAIPEDTIPYEVVTRIHAYSLYMGLMRSDEIQLRVCKEAVADILLRVKSGSAYYEQVFTFWMCVIFSLNNKFLNRFTDYFISRYLYLLPPSHLSAVQRQLISDSSLDYYGYLFDALERRDFGEFPERFERHYHNYYQNGGVVFSKLENEGVFKEQALYGKVLDGLCTQILSGELQKGDSLPTTRYLCTKYGVSTTTVNRAYGILAEMNLISRHVRSGTKLIAELDDPAIWTTLETAARAQLEDWQDAVEAIIIISRALSSHVVIAPAVAQEMRTELSRQSELFERYGSPFFASEVLVSPLIASFPAGILHKYYIQLADALSRVITLCTFRVRENEQHGKEIYQLTCNALDALDHGDQSLYMTLSEQAMRRNAEMLTEDYNRITNY